MKLPFLGSNKIVTVLEIDENWLKAIQAEISPNEKRICRMLVKKISTISEDTLINIIREISKELKIDQKHLIISLPAHFATIRNPEFPSTNAEEIKNMVELQIGKQTPYSTSEIVSDYQIVYASPDGYSRVTLVIVHRDIINRYFRILEKAGLKTDRITLNSEGALNWYYLAFKNKIENSPFLFIDIDYTSSNLVFILQNKIIFNRVISLGFSQSAEDIDKWHKDFIEEVNRSFYAYQNEMINKEITKIIISGSERLTSKLNDNLLKDSFKLPVEIAGQFKNIYATKETLDLYGGDLKDVSLSSLIGFAFVYNKDGISLLPQEVRMERSMKKRAKGLYFLGIFLAFILIVISGIFLEKIYNKESYLNKLKKKTASIKDRADKLSGMMKKIQITKARSDARGSVLNMFYEIYRVISPDIYLSSVSFDGKHSVTLRGSSSVMSEVFKFVNELEKSDYFDNVKTKYVSKNLVEGKEVVEFEIVCPLSAALQKALKEY